jgi:hypothetical protein
MSVEQTRVTSSVVLCQGQNCGTSVLAMVLEKILQREQVAKPIILRV